MQPGRRWGDDASGEDVEQVARGVFGKLYTVQDFRNLSITREGPQGNFIPFQAVGLESLQSTDCTVLQDHGVQALSLNISFSNRRILSPRWRCFLLV